MNILSELKKRASHRGRFTRGAISRIAERMEVSRTTVKNWFSGEFTPGKASLLQIQKAVEDKTDWLARRKPGPKGPWKNTKNIHIPIPWSARSKK